jgi:hypothetical protein
MASTKFTLIGIDITGDDEKTVAVFAEAGDFKAFYRAQAWCEGQGVSVGEMQGPEPIGLLRGDFAIAKWRNLSAAERRVLDGTITGDKRNGPVTVTLKAPR